MYESTRREFIRQLPWREISAPIKLPGRKPNENVFHRTRWRGAALITNPPNRTLPGALQKGPAGLNRRG